MGGETYTAEVFVQELHISVDQLQCDELIVLALDGTAEIEAGISEDKDTSGVAGGAAGPASGPRHSAQTSLFSSFPAQRSVFLLEADMVAP